MNEGVADWSSVLTTSLGYVKSFVVVYMLDISCFKIMSLVLIAPWKLNLITGTMHSASMIYICQVAPVNCQMLINMIMF